ncbi:MAG: 5-formyltetrahydrofolate cyclo-ligase [Kurthia sp.]|nr:5-formyltetrahydrofolate cyclo-ligase [Candidatus Kurthia equi]
MNKKQYRKNMLIKLQNMAEEDYLRKSKMIHNKLLNMKEIQHAQIIALTISNFPEVNTKLLIEALWKIGKTIVIPKCHPKTKEMDFYVFQAYDQLEIVYMNLSEPKIEITKKIRKEQIDLIISPGVVFDTSGYRIGFGGGYYDRFLQGFTKKTISMAFEIQIVEKVPVDAYDLPIEKIITEERIIHCNDVRKDEMK